MRREDVRSIATIVHVDHGRTTLVDQLLRQNYMFRANQEVQGHIMDSNDLGRERGVTILPKNTAVSYEDTKINITDTLRHTDFGGEVERVLKMVDGVMLTADAYEGPMPQTKFVFQKAPDLNLSVIVCINKIDRPEARPVDVIDETLELMMDLDAADEQLDCPFIYVSAKGGFAKCEIEDPEVDMSPLFETIINHIPVPEGDPNAETQVLISTTDYNEFIGRIGTGRVDNGRPKVNQGCVLVNYHELDRSKKTKIGKLHGFDEPKRAEVQKVGIGFIVVIPGIADIHIGDTIHTPDNLESIPFQKISGPTTAIYFMVNDSPLADQEGKLITSRHLHNCMFRELNTDVSLRVKETGSAGCFKVSGRDELYLSVLIENMRREDFEFVVSRVEILYKYDEGNRRLKPTELAYVDVPEEYTDVVIQRLTSRKSVPQGMNQAAGGYSRLEFSIPSGGLIGYRGDFLINTGRNGTPNAIFDGYAEYKGDLFYRQTGSLIVFEAGEAITCGLSNAQERDILLIGSDVRVYSGMAAGQSPKAESIEINVCRTKKLTGIRSSNVDEALKLTPPKVISLEQVLDLIDMDELLEVTLESLCIRKRTLDPTLRRRASFKDEQIKIDIL